MAGRTKIEFTADVVRKAIEGAKPTSLAALAHRLGFKGSISSAITGRLRAVLPDVEALVAACKAAKEGAATADKPAAKPAEKASTKPVKAKAGKAKVPRHPQNPFREGSYGTCFDVLATHPEGLPRERLIALLAKATGKPEKLAAFDVQVVCSAQKNGEGLDPFQGPRNRSCRGGFYMEGTNGHVKLVLPPAKPAAKVTP